MAEKRQERTNWKGKDLGELYRAPRVVTAGCYSLVFLDYVQLPTIPFLESTAMSTLRTFESSAP